MDKISVVINTYNAERRLAEVLEAVKGFDEVLICDMESTDSTLQIARDYGCRVVTFPRDKYNIVEPAREFAIHEAACPWVLVVDADEVVTPALQEYLYDHVRKFSDGDALGIEIPRKNYFMGRFMRCHYPDYILRFFLRDKTHWPAVIHCSPEVDGPVVRIPQSRLDLAFEHLADDTISSRILKTDQYSTNELPKKRHKHYGTLALILRPLHFFFKTYFLKKAFLDGRAGFIKSVLEAFYQFVIIAKLLEERTSKS